MFGLFIAFRAVYGIEDVQGCGFERLELDTTDYRSLEC